MATRRFCDFCNQELTDLTDGWVVRELQLNIYEKDRPADGIPPHIIARAHIRVYNEHDHEVADICKDCQIKVIDEGDDVSMLPAAGKVTGLLQSVAADAPRPDLYREPPRLSVTPPPPPSEKPPQPIEAKPTFVPSAQPTASHTNAAEDTERKS